MTATAIHHPMPRQVAAGHPGRRVRWLLTSMLVLLSSSGLAQAQPVPVHGGQQPLSGPVASAASETQQTCRAAEELPAEINQQIDKILKERPSSSSKEIRDLLLERKDKRDCPVVDCKLAIFTHLLAQSEESKLPPAKVEERQREAYQRAKDCYRRQAEGPVDMAPADRETIEKILQTGKLRWEANVQPSYRRDVNIAIALTVVGAAFLGAGLATYGALQDHPLPTGASNCTSSFGLANEPCGTRLPGVTVTLMVVGGVALGGAAVAAVRLLAFPKTYEPK